MNDHDFGTWILSSTMWCLSASTALILAGIGLGGIGHSFVALGVGLGLACLIDAGKYRVVPGTPIRVVRRE